MPTPPSPCEEPPGPWEARNEAWLRRVGLLFVVIGVVWRVGRFLACFPVWEDEAMLLVNYRDRGYLQVLGPIDNCLIAPLLFHWVEITLLRSLGWSDWVPRLVPLLCGVVGLCLFRQVVKGVLGPLARTLAVGILAVSAWPAESCTLAKPYAGDLLVGVCFLGLLLSALRRLGSDAPGRAFWPILGLAALMPLAVFSSYPAAFLGGAACVALLVPLARSRAGAALWIAYAAACLLLLASFAAHFGVVGLAHLASADQPRTTAEGMHHFWQTYFPPRGPLAAARWLLLMLTGQMMSYPLGSINGGSAGGLLLAVLGAWALRRRHGGLLLFVAALLGAWLLAAALHKYPFGGSRTAQFSVPLVCLLIAQGAAGLLERLGEARLGRAAGAAVAFLILIAAVRLACDIARPYHDADALWCRREAARLRAEPLVVAASARPVPLMHWHLLANGPAAAWEAESTLERLGRDEEAVRVLFDGAAPEGAVTACLEALGRGGRPWRLDGVEAIEGPRPWFRYTVCRFRRGDLLVGGGPHGP